LLQLINEALDPTFSVYKQAGVSLYMGDTSELVDDIKEQLLACGLTEPAGKLPLRLPNSSVLNSVLHVTSCEPIQHSSIWLILVLLHLHLEVEP
jgi:hypothetical protein